MSQCLGAVVHLESFFISGDEPEAAMTKLFVSMANYCKYVIRGLTE